MGLWKNYFRERSDKTAEDFMRHPTDPWFCPGRSNKLPVTQMTLMTYPSYRSQYN